MEVAVGFTVSEVLYTIEVVLQAREASSEWDPDNNLRELLVSCRKVKLQRQRVSCKPSPILVYIHLYNECCASNIPFSASPLGKRTWGFEP